MNCGSGWAFLPVVAFVLETIKADRKNLAWATLVTQSLRIWAVMRKSSKTSARTLSSWAAHSIAIYTQSISA